MINITYKYSRLVVSAAASALAQGLGVLGSSLFQHHLNKEDLKESREYYEPKNQMSRLIAGGINPSRALSQGAILSSQGQDIAPTDVAANMNSVAGLGANVIQRDIADAQIRNIDSDTHLKQVQAGLTDEQRIAENFRNKVLPDILNKQLSGQQLDNELKEITKGLTDAQKAEVYTNIDLINRNIRLIDSQLEEYKFRISKAESDAAIAELHAAAEPERISKELEKLGIDNENARLMGAELSATIANINADTDIKEVEHELNRISLKYAEQIERHRTNTAYHESVISRYNEEQSLIDLQESRSGRPMANFLAPLGRITGTVGNVFRGILKR